MSIVEPVTHAASPETANATAAAMSFGSPARPSGVFAMNGWMRSRGR
jgi:hypothetical protein